MLFLIATLAALSQGSTLQAPLQIETVRQFSYRNNDHSVPLRRIQGTTPLFYQSKMSCDVDGSPNAYHPLDDNLSLDVIGSAGGKRAGDLPNGALTVLPGSEVVVYVNGAPYIQPDGEFKGFYLSETSLMNPDLGPTDPHKYLDARKTQYIVLPGGLVPEATVGDLMAAYDPISKHYAFAVYGDIGPSSECGEASLATLQRLGMAATDGKSSPGETRNDLFYVVFPGTAAILAKNRWPYPQSTIDRLAQREFRKWGGTERIEEILKESPPLPAVPVEMPTTPPPTGH